MPDGQELSGVGRSSGARNDTTRLLMEKAVESGKCPFCFPQFEENNAERIIVLDQEPKFWNVFHNSGPLPGTSHHIMLAPKRHVTISTWLEDEELSERQEIIEELQDVFGYVSFTELSRQGEMRFNSATVEHLHYHVVVSSGEPADASPIPARYLYLIDIVFEEMRKFAAEAGGDPLEYLGHFHEYVDVYREAKRGKAVPIRAKLSNHVGSNGAGPST